MYEFMFKGSGASEDTDKILTLPETLVRTHSSTESRFLNNGSSDFSNSHILFFLGHQCKTLPKVNNICYSYAWG